MGKAQTFTLWPGGDKQIMQNIQSMLLNRNTKVAMDVVIGPHKKETRSDRQNAGYWGVWMPAAALHFGVSKDKVHTGWKELMARIYMGDARNDDQKRWVSAYNDLKGLGASDDQLKKMRRLCSTTWSDTDQFATYMNDIEQAMIERELYLPVIDPEKRTR